MMTDLCGPGLILPLVDINALPDEVLLEIFDFCRAAIMDLPIVESWIWQRTWKTLVHVCQKWRHVVFSNPVGLDLRLYCTDRTHVREMLDLWPPLPIEIDSSIGTLGDNIMAALEHHDRVCSIVIRLAYSECLRLATAMQNPFPALTNLHLSSLWNAHAPVLPDTFLGGSAPRLQSFRLDGLPFTTFPQLLLSSNDLSEISLRDIPDIGYITPEAMVTGLSALTSLRFLSIEFEEFGIVQGPPPLTRALLPALTSFHFRGLNEYLENLLVRVDVPQLKSFMTWFFADHVDIRQVITHTHTFGPFDRADVIFSFGSVDIQLYESNSIYGWVDSPFYLGILEDEPGQQVSSMAQICTQSLSMLSSVTVLHIQSESSVDREDLEVLMDNPEWLVLLHPFTAVRTLRLSGKIRPFVISSLRGHTGEGATEVLPQLQNLCLYQRHSRDELEEQAIDQFVAARQHSNHPITVHRQPRPDYSDSD
jgi:F-box-like